MSERRSEIYDDLPAGLRAQADLTGSREYLWPPEAARDAIRWLADRNAAIAVVEQYGQRGQARGQFIREWQVSSQGKDEDWESYVRRAARAAEAAVEAASAESGGNGERFFFAVANPS